MKKTLKKLNLNLDTIRLLSDVTLRAAHGGISGDACDTESNIFCPQPSLTNTGCSVCYTEVACNSRPTATGC
jgi:hypothetical protein